MIQSMISVLGYLFMLLILLASSSPGVHKYLRLLALLITNDNIVS